ncbi:hypothetical protein D910_09665 [Dendroctonus ponderosae]|uniref:Homeobox domain-containing protein n=1 Tax=Dendroctonus ponderosae TaxID=77166 RepID=U4UQN3_DENPD|nr:hypothetical protein D910_09665 [Dendroctonus ponderosae]
MCDENEKNDEIIDHILNRAGTSENSKTCDDTSGVKFRWLQCSRYCPPRVPKQKFNESPYLSSEEVIVMSKKLQLADIRVKIWFQNRRARERRERNGVIGDFKTKDEKNVPLDGVNEEKLTRIHCGSNDSSESRPNQQALVTNIKSEFNIKEKGSFQQHGNYLGKK